MPEDLDKEPSMYRYQREPKPKLVRPANLQKTQGSDAAKCEHEWKRYKQQFYDSGKRYWVIRGCHKCKTKVIVDMVVVSRTFN